MDASKSLSISITSYSLDSGNAFPFVTLPNYEIRVAKALKISNSDAIAWFPLVAQDQRQAWEEYSVTEAPIWLRTALDQSGREDEPVPDFVPVIHDGQGSAVDGPMFEGTEGLGGYYSVSW